MKNTLTKKSLKATLTRLYEERKIFTATFGEDDESYEKTYEAIVTLVNVGLLDRSYLETAAETDHELFIKD